MYAILSSEFVKMRRSRYWGLVIVFPLLLVGLDAAILLLNHDTFVNSEDIWGSMWLIMYYTNFVAIHLFVALLASLLANMEHQSKTWKLVFAFPVSRVAFYWVKVFFLVSGILLSGTILMVGFGVIGLAFGAGEALNLTRLFSFTLFPYLTTFAIMGLQLWLSMVIDNQSISIVAGGLGIIIGLFSVSYPGVFQYLPWTLPYQFLFSPDNMLLQAAMIIETPLLEWNWVLISLYMGILFFGLGALHFSAKQVS